MTDDDLIPPCIACGSEDVDIEGCGIRCYDCGYVHPLDADDDEEEEER